MTKLEKQTKKLADLKEQYDDTKDFIAVSGRRVLRGLIKDLEKSVYKLTKKGK